MKYRIFNLKVIQYKVVGILMKPNLKYINKISTYILRGVRTEG